MRSFQFISVAAAAALSAIVSTSHASQSDYNRISFSVNAKQEVANDEIQATLTKTTQAKTVAEIAKNLNKTTNDALIIAKKYPNVAVKTSYHDTYPRYGTNHLITGFTGLVSIEIKSQDLTEASQLIAELQSLMALENLSFHVSSNANDAIKKQLILDAVKHFQEEAAVISQAFGAKDYKIVSVKLGDDNNYHTRTLAPMMAMAKDASIGIENPKFESGKTTIGYDVSGTIELIK